LAKGKNLTLNDGVREKLVPIFESALKRSDFGNGRFARNLIEKAQMKQASRLVNMVDIETITKDDVATLIAEDFDEPTGATAQNAVRKIGFVA
jgi:hypothetical protein